MTKACAALHPKVNRTLNEIAKSYKESGMSNEDARKQATNDVLQTLEQDTLGSQNTGATSTGALWSQELNSTTVGNIFDSLAIEDKLNPIKDTNDHKKHLVNLLDKLIIPAINRLDGYMVHVGKSASENFGTINPTQKTVEINLGIPPQLNTLLISAQEVMAHELVHGVTATIDLHVQGSAQLQKDLRRLYEFAGSKITWQDLMQKDASGNVLILPGSNLAAEEAAAKARWEYIFKNKNGQHEFIAFGNTNAQFMKLLSGIKYEVEKAKSDGTMLGAATTWFKNALIWLSNHISQIKDGQTADIALQNLTSQIAGLNQKHNTALRAVSAGGEAARYAVAKPTQLILAGLGNVVDVLPNSKVKTGLQNIKHIPRAVATSKFAEGMAYTADRLFKMKGNFVFNLLAKLPSELIGMSPENSRFWALHRYSKGIIDVARHKMRDATLYNYITSFSKPLTDDEDRALFNLISSDISALAEDNRYTYDEILELINDSSKLKAEISKYKNNIIKREGDIGYGLVRQAEGLSFIQIRNETFNEGDQVLNVANIVDLKFDPNTKRKVKDRDLSYKEVDILKTLYALSIINQIDKNNIVKVFERELAKDPLDNGIVNFISLMYEHKNQSKEKNFDGNERLMSSGYASQILDPHVSIEFSVDPDDIKLKNAGFVLQSGTLKKAKGTSHQPQYLYVSTKGGLPKYTKTIISLTSEQKSGTGLEDIYRNQDFKGRSAFDQAKIDTVNIIAGLKDPYRKSWDVGDITGLLPVTNEDGDIVSYRYVMSEANKGLLLKRNYKASTVVSTMYEQMTDKHNTVSLNTKVVQDLIADRKQFGVKRAKDYITITENHPQYGELYKRLPMKMKFELDKAFGVGNLIVREPLVDLVFGFPNYILTKDGMESYVGKTALMIIQGILRLKGISKEDAYYKNLSVNDKKDFRDKRAKLLLNQTEEIWQEIVTEIKGIIVLKTLVLPFNIISNTVLSFLNGLPLDYMLKKQTEAIIALQDFNDQYREREVLKQRIKGIGLSANKLAEYQNKIDQLTFNIDQNPVKNLIELGVLNSIVEDISLDEDVNVYSVRSKVSDWLEQKTEKVPKILKDAHNLAYIAKGSKPYKFLETTTRYSDFVARYAMYHWFTEEKRIPKEEALATTMASFVEYDPPTSKELQYLNDMGLTMFTKYTIRIQKVMAKLFLEKPETAVGLYLLEQHLGLRVASPNDVFLDPNWNYVLKDIGVVVTPGAQLVNDITDTLI